MRFVAFYSIRSRSLEERQQLHFASHQHKVKDLENKLKESEGNSLMWQQKIRDLEMKQKDRESQEALLLRQKELKDNEWYLEEQQERFECYKKHILILDNRRHILRLLVQKMKTLSSIFQA